MKDYINYTIKDFVLDPGFQKWVLRRDDSQKLYWELWLSEHPEKQEIVKYAKKILQSMQSLEDPISYNEIESQWQQISAYFDQYYTQNCRISSFLYQIFGKFGMIFIQIWRKIIRLYHSIKLVFRHMKYKKFISKTKKRIKKTTFRLSNSYIVTCNNTDYTTFMNHFAFNLLRTNWLQGNTFLSLCNSNTDGISRLVINTPNIQMTIMDTELDSTKHIICKGEKIILHISTMEEPILMIQNAHNKQSNNRNAFKLHIDPNSYLFLD